MVVEREQVCAWALAAAIERCRIGMYYSVLSLRHFQYHFRRPDAESVIDMSVQYLNTIFIFNLKAN